MVVEAQDGVIANEMHWISEVEIAADQSQAYAEEALAVVARDFPRIATQVSKLWGRVDFDAYMEKLLIDERGGRSGFPLAIADALLRLSRVHAECFGFGRADDVWIDIDFRQRRHPN
jgi:hypothetical protein